VTIIFGFVTLIFATWKDENSKFFRFGSPEFSALLTQNLVKFKEHFAFLLQKNDFCEVLKKIVHVIKVFIKKDFQPKKQSCEKNLKQIVIALLKKNEHQN
jgi:thiosulfate reductase cytochrome b subunit